MAYFPFFVDIGHKEGLIVGGGRVAAQKAEKLIPFGVKLTVIAPEIDERLLHEPFVSCIQREFEDSDVEGRFFVVAATADETLNLHISRLCAERNILVNVVDDKEKCGFLFPSLVKRGDLVAAVSTGGDSPQIAVKLRQSIEELLPEHVEEILDYLAELRIRAKKEITDTSERHNFLKTAADLCLRKGDRLTEEETAELVLKYTGKLSAERLSET